MEGPRAETLGGGESREPGRDENSRGEGRTEPDALGGNVIREENAAKDNQKKLSPKVTDRVEYYENKERGMDGQKKQNGDQQTARNYEKEGAKPKDPGAGAATGASAQGSDGERLPGNDNNDQARTFENIMSILSNALKEMKCDDDRVKKNKMKRLEEVLAESLVTDIDNSELIGSEIMSQKPGDGQNIMKRKAKEPLPKQRYDDRENVDKRGGQEKNYGKDRWRDDARESNNEETYGRKQSRKALDRDNNNNYGSDSGGEDWKLRKTIQNEMEQRKKSFEDSWISCDKLKVPLDEEFYKSNEKRRAEQIRLPRERSRPNDRRRESPRRRKELSSGEEPEKVVKIVHEVDRNKNVPPPEVFDITAGKSFTRFWGKFERYCRCKYSNEEDDWVDVLGKYLKGEMKDIYRPAQENEQSYQYIKKRLINWYTAKRRNIEIDRRHEFAHAVMKKNENVHAYMYRLEDLAQAAFSDAETQEAELSMKLMKTAPSDFVEKIKEQSWLKSQNGTGYLTWEQVKVMASFRDENRTKRRVRSREQSWSEDEDERDVANITVKEGQRKRKEDNKSSRDETEPRRTSRGEVQSGNRGPKVICRYCQRAGHIEKECWRKQGACLACGQKGHIAVNCPVKPWDPQRFNNYDGPRNRGGFDRNREYVNRNSSRSYGRGRGRGRDDWRESYRREGEGYYQPNTNYGSGYRREFSPRRDDVRGMYDQMDNYGRRDYQPRSGYNQGDEYRRDYSPRREREIYEQQRRDEDRRYPQAEQEPRNVGTERSEQPPLN